MLPLSTPHGQHRTLLQLLSPRTLPLGANHPSRALCDLETGAHKPLPLKFSHLIGFFDDQLNVPPKGNWSDLVGNRAFSYYFPSEARFLVCARVPAQEMGANDYRPHSHAGRSGRPCGEKWNRSEDLLSKSACPGKKSIGSAV